MILFLLSFHVPSPLAAQSSCGNFPGLGEVGCPAGSFCLLEDGACGGAGQCTQYTDTLCTQDFAFVCGCDGVTYANPCQAVTSQMSISYEGCCCVGDCNADGAISVDELVRGVRIALSESPLDECSSFDSNLDGVVSISELIRAIKSSLEAGCAQLC